MKMRRRVRFQQKFVVASPNRAIDSATTGGQVGD
jgi:hypothetical protein